MTRRHRPAARRAPRGWRVLLPVVLVLALLPRAALAAPAPPVLTNGTSITWSGNAGMVLRVDRRTTLPRYGARLTVRGGTYAFVRFRSRYRCHFTPQCQVSWWIDYARAFGYMTPAIDGPGTDHFSLQPEPLEDDTYEVYLLTDGTATLTFDGLDLPRARRAYRATGRVTGAAVAMPVVCGTPGCTADGYGNRLRGGGIDVDVGRVGGVDFIVGSWDRARPPTWQYPQLHGARGCIYLHDPGTHPEHPLGCDPQEALHTAAFVPTLLPLYSGQLVGDGMEPISGPVYVGFQSLTAHDVSDPVVVAYAVWLRYGIH